MCRNLMHNNWFLYWQIQDNKCVATQAGIDYRGSDYTASLTLGNLDVVNMSGKHKL